MNNRRSLLFVSLFSASLFAPDVFATSVIRVGCIGEAEGARIFIDGKAVAACPTVLFVEAGISQIRAVKPVGEDRERIYETTVEVPENGVERVHVELSAPRLTAEATRRRAQEKLAAEMEAARSTLAAARQGDIEAMERMAQLYRSGTGVEKNAEKAGFWRQKAREEKAIAAAETDRDRANAGQVEAMRDLADRYQNGNGVEKSDELAAEWRSKAEKVEADRALSQAEAGNVEAMQEMAKRYSQGAGVDRDLAESEKWASKAAEITSAREKQEREIADRRWAQKRLDSVDFFQNTKEVSDFARPADPDPTVQSMASFFTPFSYTGGILADLIEAPTKTVEMIQLKREIAARPSTFGNTDSMIARAYRIQN